MEKMEELEILIHTIERMTLKNLKVDKVNLFTLSSLKIYPLLKPKSTPTAFLRVL